VIGVSVLVVAVLGCAVARRLSASAAGPVLQRISSRITPFVLIAVGLYVLSDTSTDTLR